MGILIPPSNPMIIYGVVANVSVAGLFLSGVLPGLLLAAGLATYCLGIGRVRGYRATGIRFQFTEFLTAVWQGKAALLMPVIVLGSIYAGFATPTEASVLAVVYSAGYGLVTRKIGLRMLSDSMVQAGRLTGAVLIIMGPATAFGKLLTLYEIPNEISSAISMLSSDPFVVLLLIAVFLVFVGMFMETLSTIVLLTPVFLPVLIKLGVDPVQFGILFVVLSEVGFLTPPLGVNLYVASAISGESVERVSRAIIPFVLVLLGFCTLLIFVPWLSTVGYDIFTGKIAGIDQHIEPVSADSYAFHPREHHHSFGRSFWRQEEAAEIPTIVRNDLFHDRGRYPRTRRSSSNGNRLCERFAVQSGNDSESPL